MAEAKRGGESIPWMPIATVALGLIASGALLFPSLTSSRPNIPWSGGTEGMSIQDVDARLWQDPLESIARHHDDGTAYDAKKHSVEFIRDRFLDHASSPLILAVMVNGSGYAEKIERRLRDRVAVENALDRANYTPVDAEHLGSFTVPWSRSPEDLSKTDRWSTTETTLTTKLWESSVGSSRLVLNAISPKSNSGITPLANDWARDNMDKAWCAELNDATWLSVPFEMHRPDPIDFNHQPKYDKILVLWLRQDFFADAPLARLAQLLSWFGKRSANGDLQLCAPVRILGPDTSDSLLQVIREVKSSATAPDYQTGAWQQVRSILKGAAMFSYRPSASDSILLANDSARNGDVRKLIMDSFDQKFRFYRTTPTEEVLLGAVISELALRDIRLEPESRNGSATLNEDESQIAIISEQDTLFARALPTTLDLLLERERGDPPSNIQFFNYLRGIDGRTPVVPSEPGVKFSRSGPSAGPSDTYSNDASKRSPREIPEGTDQSDYVRRLARHLAAIDELKIAQFPRRRGIEAIGVLGSDIYDKLEILHALRSRLHARLLFTTGLDARYYHPDELGATRNLVVISGFGLSLDRRYQKSVPPFRDHNQTAAFAAALCALDVMDADKVDFNKQPPRVFEICKRGPIDLSADTKSELEEYADGKGVPTDDIHPARHDLRDWWKVNGRINWRLLAVRSLAIVILVGGLVFARYLIWCDPGENSPRKVVGSTNIVFLISIPLIFLILAPIYYAQRLEGEPFNLFAGASMWPTEALRLLALILSVHFVIKSLIILRDNQLEIAPAFKLADDPSRPEHSNWLFWKTVNVRRNPKSDPVIDVRQIWAEYCFRSKLGSRLLATAFWSAIYLVAVVCVWPVFRHAITPGRGSILLGFDRRLVLYVVMPASIFLTFFVVHATLLDARLARLLSKGRTLWPEPVREMYQLDSDSRAGCSDFTGEYLDILLIARRTRAVTRLIYYPFIIISLLIICRLPIFDDFDWPPLLILMFCFNIAISCGCVFILRRLAESARKDSVDRLRKELQIARAQGPTVRRKAIEDTLEQIEKMDIGIFAPITRQPVIGALLLPSGSAGIWALLQYVR